MPWSRAKGAFSNGNNHYNLLTNLQGVHDRCIDLEGAGFRSEVGKQLLNVAAAQELSTDVLNPLKVDYEVGEVEG